LLPGYLAFNGMNDGWFELRAVLKTLRTLGPDSYTQVDWEIVNDLIQAADRAVHPHPVST